MFHTHVVPSFVGGMTLALIPPESAVALWRSACTRAAELVLSVLDERGGVMGAAPSSLPTRLGAAAGEPAAPLTAPKL
ncbi:MAG: hypothetical protein DMD60_03395 [Gemmatimonadetes bacterium]|nr:MAG: hypothetical protein DMD60_03395 [Gemmatimonadota bacterium]